MEMLLTNCKSNSYTFIAYIIFVLSFIIGCCCLDATGIYSYIAVIPFTYAILNLIFKKVYIHISMPKAVVLAFMFIRYSLTMLILHVEGYPVDESYTFIISNDLIIYSTFLMTFEMIFIFIALFITSKKHMFFHNYIYKINVGKKDFSKYNIFTYIILLLTVILYIIFPQLFKNFNFILDSSLNKIGSEDEEVIRTLPFGINFIGYTLGEIFRFVVVQKIITTLYIKSLKRNNKMFGCFIFSILIVSCNTMITASRLVLGLLMNAVFVYEIFMLYPKYKKLLKIVIVVFGGLFAFGVFAFYWGPSLGVHSFSLMIQNYTCGYYDVYQSICAYAKSNLSLDEKIVMFIWGDGISNFVVISTFAKPSYTTSTIYNYYLYARDFDGGIIAPLISQSSFYLTPFFAPFVSFLYVIIANKFEKMAYRNNSNFVVCMFLSTSFMMVPFMYNTSILIHFVTNIVLPIYLVSSLNTIGTTQNNFLIKDVLLNE